MLTKNDLEAIGEIVDTSIDIRLKPVKKDISYIKKTVSVLVRRTDEAEVNLKKRVKRVEEHLGLAS